MVRAPASQGRAVVLAGGWMHPAAQCTPSLTSVLVERGLEVEVVTDPALIEPSLAEVPSLLVAASCWFSMSDDRYSEEQRAEWAIGRDVDREAALLAAADRGVPLLAMHTAVICFDGWLEWGQWLGGHWDWATSSHPPPRDLPVRPEPGASLAIAPFTVVDEEYQQVVVDPEAEILARSEAGHPLVWLRDGDRRTAVNLLGHDQRSLDQPGHRAMLGQLIDWLV